MAKQYDMNTRFIKATFVDNGDKITIDPSATVKVVINAQRPDGLSKGFYGEVNEDGTVTVPLHSWMLDQVGTVICDISVIDVMSDDNKKLTTTSFTLYVEQAAYGGEDITSDPQFDVLVELMLPSDWEQKNAEKGDYIRNKPPIAKGSDGGIVQTVDREERQNEAVSSATAFGCWNRVRRGYSLAAGWGNQVDAEKSAVFGAYNLLSGNANLANGRCNEAKGYAGVTLGQDNLSLADNAMCFGESLIATAPGQVVVGRNNAPNDDAVFIVGNGGVHRSNAFTVLKDGRVTSGGSFGTVTETVYIKRIWNLYTITGNVSLSTGSMVSESGSHILTVTSGTNAGGTRPQVNVGGADYGSGVEKIQVEQGKSYRFSFQLRNPQCRVRFWLCATDNTTEGFTATSQKDACVIYETDGIPLSEAWQTVTAEIPDCAYSGYLRLGICSTDTDIASFELKDIATEQIAPTYHYVSKDGTYSTTLYKIANLQSTPDHTRDWLSHNNIKFAYNISDTYKGVVQGSAEKLEEADASNKHDDQLNPMLLHTFIASRGEEVAVVCVERIVPDKMDVPERGIYVSPYISKLTHNQWTDKSVTLK